MTAIHRWCVATILVSRGPCSWGSCSPENSCMQSKTGLSLQRSRGNSALRCDTVVGAGAIVVCLHKAS